MPFHSHEFILLFLPVTLAGYFLLKQMCQHEASKLWLVVASLFFYSRWNVAYVPLLLCSAAVNYLVSGGLQGLRSKGEASKCRRLLISGIAFNVAFLGYFKYSNFFIENINAFFGAAFPSLHVILPIGISFYTLQQIAFLVDVYGGLIEEKNLLDYLLFVTFFPSLTAGPIVRHRDQMPQFSTPANRSVNYQNISLGIFIFSIGLFKKVMVASMLDGWVGELHALPVLGFIDSWDASLLYTLQLYFDFSGYSDMAVGLALLFNITLLNNFNSPLKATNIVEFWKRWHISFANFMRAYLFTPMIMSRKKPTFAFSLWVSFVVMLIMGVWHGAGWNYILFGVMHGLAVVIFSLWMKSKIKLPKAFGCFLNINFINLSLVSIRAGDISETSRMMKGMLGLNGMASCMPNQWIILTCLTVMGLLGVVLRARNSMEMAKSFQPNFKYLLLVAVLFMLSVFHSTRSYSEFIYFKF